MNSKSNNNGRDNRGAKRKTPDSALDALLYKNDISTYYLQQNGILNAGYVHNKAKRNVLSYNIRFLMRIGKVLNMRWNEVGESLLKLQAIYPPKEAIDHREPNTKWAKRHKRNK